jgi:hypothetical protein
VTVAAERDRDGWAVSHTTREHDGQVVTAETRVRVSTLPAPRATPEVQRQREADRRSVELFVFEHGRNPAGPEDGEAHLALVREQKRNLRHQAQTPPQPFEPDQGQWRRWTAALALGRMNRAEAAPPSRRSTTGSAREPHPRRRRHTSSRSRDRPRREPEPEPDPPDVEAA